MFLTRLLVAATLAMFSCAFAQGISYTVQVVALSDQESALNVQRTLLDDAFPAYVVRASVAQGDIYRVRVGSFANRLAALEYAQAMPNVAGSRPLPALAEGIPEGIMPVEPRLLLQYVPEANEQAVDQRAAESASDEPDAADTDADDDTDDDTDAEDDAGTESTEATAGDGDATAGPQADGVETGDEQDEDAVADEVADDDEQAEGEVEPTTADQPEDGEALPSEARADAAAAEPAAVDIEVVAWDDTFALRTQPEPEAPATYTVPSVAGVRSFEAWRAAPADAGILRVRNLLLWPADWQELSVEAREEHRLELINWVARRVGVGPGDIEPLQRRPVFGPPYLVVLELAGDGDTDPAVLGVTAPEGEPAGYGPDGLSVGDGQYPAIEEPLFVVSPGFGGTDEGVMGEGWSATPDARFFQVVSGPGESSWRAGLGRPLWAAGSHLLTRDGDRLLLYEFISD